jgi:pSer/pThr/pTyr-binding forkhead associated (FHA) protein
MPKPSRFQLTVQLGPEIGVVHTLTGDLVTIGRYTGNTITIPDEQVSRIHARLTRTGDSYTVEDLNSSNGLFVNSVRVTHPTLLSSGDLVRLGTSVVMLYEVFESGSIIPIPSRSVPSGEARFSRPVSDTSGTVYMKKIDALPPTGAREPSEKKSPLAKLLNSLLGKKG